MLQLSSDDVKMMYPELDYFMNDEQSDVVFVIDGQRVPAIKHVLSIKSDVFRAMFSGNWKESSDREVRIEDTTFDAFKSMIQFLYTGHVILDDDRINKIDFIRNMIVLAERYQLKRLVEEMCVHIKNELSLDNFDDICTVVLDLDARPLIPILKSYMRSNFCAFKQMDLKRLKTIDKCTDQSWLEVVMVEQFKTSVTECNESTDFSAYPEFEYFMNEDVSDVVFIVGEHKVPASRQLLALKSLQFRNLFEKNGDVKEMTLEGTTFEAFKDLMYFIYTDNIRVDQCNSIANFPSVCELACKYKIYRYVHQHVESMVITVDTFELIAETAYNMSREYKSVLLLGKLEQFMDDNFKQHFYRRDIEDLKRINKWSDQSLFKIVYSRLKKARSLFGQHSFQNCSHYCQKEKRSRFSTVLQEKLTEQNVVTFENFDEKCRLIYESKSESEILNVKLFIGNNFEKFYDKDIGDLNKINELTDQSLFEIWIQRLKMAQLNYEYSHDRHESHSKRYGRRGLPTFI